VVKWTVRQVYYGRCKLPKRRDAFASGPSTTELAVVGTDLGE
jgi:hypothetical protein